MPSLPRPSPEATAHVPSGVLLVAPITWAPSGGCSRCPDPPLSPGWTLRAEHANIEP